LQAVGLTIHIILWVFIALLWVRFVVDWVQIFARSWVPRGVLLVLLEAVYSTTDPPIKALRRVIPPLRIGSISLDLSFLIVMIAAYVLLRLNDQLLLELIGCTLVFRRCGDDLAAAADAIVRPTVILTINEWVRSCR